jgi:hypothetical protein
MTPPVADKSAELSGLAIMAMAEAQLREPTTRVLLGVADERRRQNEIWGEQSHPDGTGRPGDAALADAARKRCDSAFKAGKGTYRHILEKEVFEAFAETDKLFLRAELVQVAAVATAWIEKLETIELGEETGQ